MAHDTPVFISYARRDESYATELMERLAREPDIAPWQDRISMSPGDFEDQIKQGIDASDYFVLVLTPAALRSPWVEKEWRYARENGRCVVPIKPTFDSADVDAELTTLRQQLPIWMQNTQTYDFDRYWKRFVAVLQSPCQATRSPFLATNLPANFVNRQDEFERIVDRVLDVGRKNPSGRTVVLHGTGGFGKTTLALSVCHDADVFAACDGGILWVTLGQQPQIVPELERIYAALTGQRPGFKSPDDAMFEVAKKLEGRRCLLVVDDVWNFEDLKPFLHGASAASRLVTSRVHGVAVSAAPDEGSRIDIGALSAEEANRMLAAGFPVPDGTVQIGLLAERLKRVPLLLQLANRCLIQQLARPGETADGALNWAFQQYTDLGVVAFDEQNAKERHNAVCQTVEISLGFLADERQRCLELGVLHEDADIPFSVLGALWGLKETQVQALAQRLHDFALIKLNVPGRSIRLHDYIREYLARTLPDRARAHGRLVDAWTRERPPGGYPVQHIVYHIVECMADSAQVLPRATQLIALLGNERFEKYQREHGDATALDRKLTLAIGRVADSTAPEIPGLLAALVLLRKSYAAKARDAALVFQTAAEGHIDAAAALLTLFGADRHWDTLARLLIAWVAPPDKAHEARALMERAARSCDEPYLQSLLKWLRQPKGVVPPDVREITDTPSLRKISAILQRAGGGEGIWVEGLEPLTSADPVSGTDAAGFIAERDAPDLVAFAKLDPVNNTEYLERYIDIHAANRYAYYRNRSLEMLLQPILEFPDPDWVRRLIQRIATAALTVTTVDFEEFLPLAVRGRLALGEDPAALGELERARQQLLQTAAALRPEEGRTDSWSHYHRRTSALAEVFAALDRAGDAADLLEVARELPKGFAGFRAPAALTLAESTSIVAPGETVAREIAMASARASAHWIQDPRFCLHTTAMVNAMQSRWADMTEVDLEATVERFLDEPRAAEFCAVHRVLEQFEHREEGQQQFQALPIPTTVRQARTLGAIAAIFDYEPGALAAVNDWIWAEGATVLTEVLQKDDAVNIPDEDFIPILAARFAAAAVVADGLSPETRTRMLQRLVRLALPNPTAVDTVLGRLILSNRDRLAPLPSMLRDLALPEWATSDSPDDYKRLIVL